jgi:hypothetical protein
MSRKFKEPSVQEDIKHFPFSVIERNNKPVIKINTDRDVKIFTPGEIMLNDRQQKMLVLLQA